MHIYVVKAFMATSSETALLYFQNLKVYSQNYLGKYE